MDVRESVESDLRKLPDDLQSSALAASALRIADLIPEASPRDLKGLIQELRQVLAELRALAASHAPREVDPVDELANRRAARLSA